ncbi:MAG: transposase [Dehalococcoidia bacterium]|nr:transposase [Dehalococcoidia bacterium]
MHHRRSIRLATFDYSQSGAYFITLCTWGRVPLFGSIGGNAVVRNGFGEIVEEEWLRSSEIRSEIELDAYVVMPNHLHGVVFLIGGVGATGRLPRRFGAEEGPGRRSLASFAGGLKAATTTRINRARGTPGAPVWQRNFFERVLRSECELERARQYVLDNPRRWAEDPNNPLNAASRPANHAAVGATSR